MCKCQYQLTMTKIPSQLNFHLSVNTSVHTSTLSGHGAWVISQHDRGMSATYWPERRIIVVKPRAQETELLLETFNLSRVAYRRLQHCG